MNTKFFYFVSHGKFALSDIELCANSDRSIDIKLFDLANNEPVLNLLHLWYMQGNYGVTYDYNSRAEWFCGYLSSFKRGEDAEKMREKALTNPIVRLLLTDDDLRNKVKLITTSH